LEEAGIVLRPICLPFLREILYPEIPRKKWWLLS